MKLISWNCNMAFRRKAAAIMPHRPDLMVVSECECPEKLVVDKDLFDPTDVLWFGENKNKGLGVFSFGPYRLQLLEAHNPDFRMVVPIKVTGGEFDFNLFAVCSNNPTDKDGRYVQQVWKL